MDSNYVEDENDFDMRRTTFNSVGGAIGGGLGAL